MKQIDKGCLYLNKGLSRRFQRKDGRILSIQVTNESERRLKIPKKFDRILNNILKEIFLANGEYIL